MFFILFQATELDNGTLTNATVTKDFSCIIRDLNDNGPVFDNSTYSVEVPEVNTDRAREQIPNFVMVVTDKDEVYSSLTNNLVL